MRWDRLFDDLEAQLEAQDRRERDGEIADRTRAERARVTLSERLVAAVGAQLALRLLGGDDVRGELLDTGEGWLLLQERTRTVLVPLPAVVSIHGLSGARRDDARARRFGLGYALRVISRDRRPVVVGDIAGGSAHGTVDAVGADAFDLAEHPLDAPRRRDSVLSVRTIPFAGLASVSSG